MTTESYKAALDKLRGLLHQREEQRVRGINVPEDVAEKIARSLLGEPPSGATCADVEAQLPEYVDAELRGAPVARQYPALTRHLAACVNCSALHADLLDLELAPEFEPLPVPDLAVFHRRAALTELKAFVLDKTEKLLTIFRIPAVDLPDLAEAFFDRVQAWGENLWAQPVTSGVYGLDGGEFPQAARFLAATWVATRRLARQLTPAGTAAAQAQDQLAATVHQVALRAATDLGLPDRDAARFAAEYTRLVLQPGTRFPFLADDR